SWRSATLPTTHGSALRRWSHRRNRARSSASYRADCTETPESRSARTRARPRACWAAMRRVDLDDVAQSRDLSSEPEEQVVQVFVPLQRRLAPVHGAGSHVVDEFVILLRKSVLLTLAVERDLGPLERAVGVTEGAGAVLLGLGCHHAFSETLRVSLVDRRAHTLFNLSGQAGTSTRACSVARPLDAVGKRMEVDAPVLSCRPQRALNAANRVVAVALAGAQQHADAGCESALNRGEWVGCACTH